MIIRKLIGFGINMVSLVSPSLATKKLMHIFATPPKASIRPKEKTFLATAKQLKMQRAGVEIVEYHWGNQHAPLIVLSYGWAYNAGRWRHFMETLVEHNFHVVAYDPPGHGNAPHGELDLPTNSAIIQGIIEDYGGATAVLAHSFGGASSVYAVQGLPRYLQPKRMVIMASFSHTPSVFKAYGKSLGLWKLTYQRMIDGFEKRFGISLRHFDLGLMTSNLTHIEGLLVHSPSDKVTPFGSAVRYHNYWKNSYLYAPKEGGHHLGTTEITSAVLDFILYGTIPNDAEKQEKALDLEHDLERYFAGL
jgi:pimeloyl-ACP methyl ester carboxylesterase